jgi:hypothetical protein
MMWLAYVVMFVLSLYAVEQALVWFSKRSIQQVSQCVECGCLVAVSSTNGYFLCDTCTSEQQAEYEAFWYGEEQTMMEEEMVPCGSCGHPVTKEYGYCDAACAWEGGYYDNDYNEREADDYEELVREYIHSLEM